MLLVYLLSKPVLSQYQHYYLGCDTSTLLLKMENLLALLSLSCLGIL